MPLRLKTITQLSKLLPREEVAEVVRLAKDQDRLEARWRGKLKRKFAELEDQMVDHLLKYGRVPENIDFEDFFVEQSFRVMETAIKNARKTPSQQAQHRLALPKGRMPTTLRELMVLWDAYRKKGKVPPRQREIAKRVKKAYLDKVQSVWEKHARDFRNGYEAQVYNQEAVREVIQRASKAPFARAKTIVETETTRYYNQVRREIYDQSDDVTHYLFVSIRDHATTKWCKTRNGLVYAKGDPLLKKETPPIHWNCRSELLPLTRLNPRHAAIISDLSKHRRRHTCEPLPKGWNAA